MGPKSNVELYVFRNLTVDQLVFGTILIRERKYVNVPACACDNARARLCVYVCACVCVCVLMYVCVTVRWRV